jgi:hypothetical protein
MASKKLQDAIDAQLDRKQTAKAEAKKQAGKPLGKVLPNLSTVGASNVTGLNKRDRK